jgi:hypothetical protein
LKDNGSAVGYNQTKVERTEVMSESTETKNEEQQKKPYVKPKIRRVELRPQEAVLGGCKTAGQTIPCQINPGSAPGT